MKRLDFERLVAEAIRSIPRRFRQRLTNVAIVVEDEPSPALLEEMGIEPPDTLLLVTDGITESAARNDVEFGVERLVDYARAHRDCSAQSLAEGVCQAARRFAAS